jgi:hypothetical protein
VYIQIWGILAVLEFSAGKEAIDAKTIKKDSRENSKIKRLRNTLLKKGKRDLDVNKCGSYRHYDREIYRI